MTIEEFAADLCPLARYSLEAVHPLATESRNLLARLDLLGRAGRVAAILKLYDPSVDPHWANRYRREEKVLTLLSASKPPVAPHPLAGFLTADGPAALLMEDAGETSLADALPGSDDAAVQWREAAHFLGTLHAAMRARRLPLYRTAMAISLDRITGPVLRKRAAIASERILGRAPEGRVLSAYRALLAPLLAAPKAMVHNSLSPLNVVIGPAGWRAIDWETLTWASPAWDWAELLRAPYAPLPFSESEALMLAEADGEVAPSEEAARDLFRRAVLSRHIDSLATVAQRRKRYEAEDRTDRAAEYARRAAFYARDLEDLAARLDPPAVLSGWLREMRESALS